MTEVCVLCHTSIHHAFVKEEENEKRRLKKKKKRRRKTNASRDERDPLLDGLQNQGQSSLDVTCPLKKKDNSISDAVLLAELKGLFEPVAKLC